MTDSIGGVMMVTVEASTPVVETSQQGSDQHRKAQLVNCLLIEPGVEDQKKTLVKVAIIPIRT